MSTTDMSSTDASTIDLVGLPQHPDASGLMRTLSRVGYGAKGVVYLVLGWLAMQGAAQAGKESALSEIVSQPFGRVLLGIVAIGLVAYSLWRLASGLVDPEDTADDDVKGIGKRVAYVASGIAYAALAWTAAGMVAAGGGGSNGGGESAEDWTAKLLEVQFGQWLVGLLAACIAAGALYQLKQAWTAGFREKFRLREMSEAERVWATRAGRIGHLARAVVYGLIAWFIGKAAISADAKDAGGLGKALDTLQAQPHGKWLLAAAGVGFIGYGIYCFVLARYRSATA